ncbi:MAG TPA: NAD(P)H-dependent oxidoreductase, partial [Chitinophagales bacterium]|nr:NAD(P)H-dependent oxidoreductase [Chitinophagales bacterium]
SIRGVTFHDLYERYPDFNIDLDYEKQLLLDHDVIVWHHPFYWYSAPPLLKQWIDIVLELGWAYGPGGVALKDKIVFNAITSGGAREVYSPTGHNRFTVRELLAPFDQTAHLCKMVYLPPFAVQGTHRLTHEELTRSAVRYNGLVETLVNGDLPLDDIRTHDFLNDWITRTLNV